MFGWTFPVDSHNKKRNTQGFLAQKLLYFGDWVKNRCSKGLFSKSKQVTSRRFSIFHCCGGCPFSIRLKRFSWSVFTSFRFSTFFFLSLSYLSSGWELLSQIEDCAKSKETSVFDVSLVRWLVVTTDHKLCTTWKKNSERGGGRTFIQKISCPWQLFSFWFLFGRRFSFSTLCHLSEKLHISRWHCSWFV